MKHLLKNLVIDTLDTSRTANIFQSIEVTERKIKTKLIDDIASFLADNSIEYTSIKLKLTKELSLEVIE